MIFVDPLLDHGWLLHGRVVRSCHMFTDSVDLHELHDFAVRIGCLRTWFQARNRVPHYDLTAVRRCDAIHLGAIALTRRDAVMVWRARNDMARLQAGKRP